MCLTVLSPRSRDDTAVRGLQVGLGTPTAIPLYVYFGSVFVIAPIGYFINMRRARNMTIPNEPFHQLLLSEDENVRNATMLAVCLSDFLDLANQNITDVHMRPISEGLRASRRLEWMKYVPCAAQDKL